MDKKKAGGKKELEGKHLEYLQNLVSGPFARASYTEAIDILLKCIQKGIVFENEVYWGVDLAS